MVVGEVEFSSVAISTASRLQEMNCFLMYFVHQRSDRCVKQHPQRNDSCQIHMLSHRLHEATQTFHAFNINQLLRGVYLSDEMLAAITAQA